ncbi:LamB/YcsF family protein [Paenibacillus sp. CFBP 13594]|uniref:LamB/YcsF family protein n=1 Tax=Paenibacillus sp. CFBP 13594 TaxID=2774037 RepID=UPI001780F361|nr:5-oxoprolinase subunit PxpA [Paenibacillus sp. CFBP 13594]MBD8841108.1 LamB/YcsF family protein [Paenibacillus sp. CFBP 13594]
MNTSKTLDINCDLGESYGIYRTLSDEAILPLITSANIACGFHAGDPATMRLTVERALEHQVAIGAHPGLPDLQGFGRRRMDITPREAYDMVVYQIGALDAFVRASGGHMHHVKPHGALYNMAAEDAKLAEAIVEAIYQVQPDLYLYGLAGSELIHAADRIGLRSVSEVFADRTYGSDGQLTPRSQAGALIEESGQAIAQVLQMVKDGVVVSTDDTLVPIKAETVCIHGDGANALAFAQEIRRVLESEGIKLSPHTKG